MTQSVYKTQRLLHCMFLSSIPLGVNDVDAAMDFLWSPRRSAGLLLTRLFPRLPILLWTVKKMQIAWWHSFPQFKFIFWLLPIQAEKSITSPFFPTFAFRTWDTSPRCDRAPKLNYGHNGGRQRLGHGGKTGHFSTTLGFAREPVIISRMM